MWWWKRAGEFSQALSPSTDFLAFGIFTAVLIEVIRSLSNRYMPRG
jgi:hypothetical protein